VASRVTLSGGMTWGGRGGSVAPRRIHVELIPSEGPPGGIGEAGVPPVAPAIMNAVFALTGQRVRTLPFLRAHL
jgi:CO/xanthine dehydrogenase Mo-binding subunit